MQSGRDRYFSLNITNFLLTNLGAIYDPVADTWTSVPPPAFFDDFYPPRAQFAPNPIGDGANVVLPDGTFMQQDKLSRQAALLDLQHLTWTETDTSTKGDLNDEEGLTLLPNGKVFTVDCYTDFAFGLVPSHPTNPTNSEIYDPQSGTWSSAGSTINSLTDPVLFEIGPAVLRPDGTVLAIGSSCTVSIYDSKAGTWSAEPMLPISPTGRQCTAKDAPGALLPNGNVLVTCRGGSLASNGYTRSPSFWYEFDGTAFNLSAGVPDGAFLKSGSFGMLVLPTGQILQTDANTDVEIYTPADTSHNPAWEPVIKSVHSHVKP